MQRRAPEVLQTSSMDCGAAALACLLQGFGIRASYGRLREACQTDVDGTSIDTIEEVARQLGLDAVETITPRDHLLLAEGDALPALVVVRQPDGTSHFVVVWRRRGRSIEIMDPATGRRRVPEAALRELLQEDAVVLPVEAAEQLVRAGSFLRPLAQRLCALGLSRAEASLRIQRACEEPGLRRIAALDAAVRLVAHVQRASRSRHGSAGSLVDAVTEAALARGEDAIPRPWWTIRRAPGATGDDVVVVSGAVMIRVFGLRPAAAVDHEITDPEGSALSPELAAAIAEPSPRPLRELLEIAMPSGRARALPLLLALVLGAVGVTFEAVLLRGLLELPTTLHSGIDRLVALGVALVFAGLLLALRLPLRARVLAAGRHLDTRVRMAFARHLPRLPDAYLRSRLTSDLAERVHSVVALRTLPELLGDLVETTAALLLTAAGIVWLDPTLALPVLVALALVVGVPWIGLAKLTEHDLRARTHVAGLSRFYLDALLGLTPITAHGAARSVRREHEGRVTDWARAAFARDRLAVATEAVVALGGLGVGAWLLWRSLASDSQGTALLLVYWVLNLPAHGQQLALLLRRLPSHRNVAARLLEPLRARTPDDDADQLVTQRYATSRGVHLELRHVDVVAGGRRILSDVDLEIKAGEHVAVVGASGAGKSTLAGLLLGLGRAARGQILVDGQPLTPARLSALRADTAWIDPQARLWTASLLDNVAYGSTAGDPATAMADADLRGVIERLPQGLQTSLGEGGRLVSGGEGQRIRVARALARPSARLVVLDEAFRGLDQAQRRVMLHRVRSRWPGATVVCVTHDVGHTLDFDRVVVIENGRIAELGRPTPLAAREGSRYRELLTAEARARVDVWGAAAWRRLWVRRGAVIEEATP